MIRCQNYPEMLYSEVYFGFAIPTVIVKVYFNYVKKADSSSSDEKVDDLITGNRSMCGLTVVS